MNSTTARGEVAVSESNPALLAVGGLVLAIGLLSGLVRRSLLSEPQVALLFGVLLGPPLRPTAVRGHREGYSQG